MIEDEILKEPNSLRSYEPQIYWADTSVALNARSQARLCNRCIDIPADVLREDIADRSSEVSKAYRRGKAASKVKLNSQEMMLAQVGSPLAIENAHHGSFI